MLLFLAFHCFFVNPLSFLRWCAWFVFPVFSPACLESPSSRLGFGVLIPFRILVFVAVTMVFSCLSVRVRES